MASVHQVSQYLSLGLACSPSPLFAFSFLSLLLCFHVCLLCFGMVESDFKRAQNYQLARTNPRASTERERQTDRDRETDRQTDRLSEIEI